MRCVHREEEYLKRIVLLCEQGVQLEVSPARYQLICELKKRNYEIYCFFRGKINGETIKNFIDQCVNTKYLSIKDYRNKIKSINPDIIVASTYEDTKILYPLALTMKNTKFVYYNLEIYTPQMEGYIYTDKKFGNVRTKISFCINKIKEIIYVQKCNVFVIQDKLRSKTSAKYFIHHYNTMLIPNTYIYNPDDDMGGERNGIVYSGGLNKLQLQTLVDGLVKIPNVPITFSGWTDKWFRMRYKAIQKVNPNICLLEHNLTQEEFTKFLNGFAVGLIWYCKTGDDNIDNIGLASGKLFKHLSLGQPVIVVKCPGLSKIIEKYKLGVVIDDVSQIKDAYEMIMKRYSFYRRNVKYVYEKKFDFSKLIAPLLEEFDKM